MAMDRKASAAIEGDDAAASIAGWTRGIKIGAYQYLCLVTPPRRRR
jgi:hypothetical protein